MAAERKLLAKEDRRLHRAREGVDIPFLALTLLLLTVGLVMLYSASFAQSAYDTGYESTTKYLQKQGNGRGKPLLFLPQENIRQGHFFRYLHHRYSKNRQTSRKFHCF